MSTPEELDRRFTLLTAAVRYDGLRSRDALAPAGPYGNGPDTLSTAEALEMLALGELLARKAGYGRQLAIRTARATGASWSQIGAALGTTKQSAWESHARWIDDQAEQHRRSGYEGLDADQVAAVRSAAGTPEGG